MRTLLILDQNTSSFTVWEMERKTVVGIAQSGEILMPVPMASVRWLEQKVKEGFSGLRMYVFLEWHRSGSVMVCAI